jgi:hypothetical protein
VRIHSPMAAAAEDASAALPPLAAGLPSMRRKTAAQGSISACLQVKRCGLRIRARG